MFSAETNDPAKMESKRNRASSIRAILPGAVLLVTLAICSSWLSLVATIEGKQIFEASAIAIILGLFLRASGIVSGRYLAGATLYEKPLIWGIVLLGAGFNLALFGAHLLTILLLLAVTMSVAFLSVYFLAFRLGLSKSMGVLLAMGTTICGTTAVAITAPLIRADSSETGYAVTVISLLGLVALLMYPLLGLVTGMSEVQFGVLAGSAIHSTAQVVGAAYIYSDGAGMMATAVKLLRNCFMAPAALLIAFWWHAKKSPQDDRTLLRKSFPWFIFGYFLMAFLGSSGWMGANLLEVLLNIGRFLIIVAMAGIGLSVNLGAVKKLGLKPMIVSAGGAGALLIVAFSLSVLLF
jgi:uncharacterized integral membrane protein (TIGR00698 family)